MSLDDDIKQAIDLFKNKEPKKLFRPYVEELRKARYDEEMTETDKARRCKELVMNIFAVDVMYHHPEVLKGDEKKSESKGIDGGESEGQSEKSI